VIRQQSASGYVLTIAENPVYFGAACDTADIVVTPARLRVTECRSCALLFTGETLRRSGTAEIRIGNTHRDDRVYHAWMRHRAYNRRSGTFDDELPVVSDNGE